METIWRLKWADRLYNEEILSRMNKTENFKYNREEEEKINRPFSKRKSNVKDCS